MVEAMALLIAAIKNVSLAPGSSRLDLGRKDFLKNSYRKKVRLGFRVRTNDAEYPAQNPWIPFSDRMLEAMAAAEGSEDLLPERELTIAAICFRVTIFAIGVVKNFEQAPASAPTPNSSRTGRVLALSPCFRSLCVRR